MKIEFHGNGFRAEMGTALPENSESAVMLRMLKNGSLPALISLPLSLGLFVCFLALSLFRGWMPEEFPSPILTAYAVALLVSGIFAVTVAVVALFLLGKRSHTLSVAWRRVSYAFAIAALPFSATVLLGALLHIVP